MHVLLVRPPAVSDAIQPSLGLGFLAAAVPPQHRVTILDGVREPFDAKGLGRRLRSDPPKVIGFQCLSSDVRAVAELARASRSVLPEVLTVVGGPHPSARPDGGLGELGPPVQLAFRGEAEPGFPALLALLEQGEPPAAELEDVPGLVFRGDGGVRSAPPAHADVERLAPPRWDLLRPESYPPSPNAAFFRRWPAAPITASRGCPFDCAFCSSASVLGRRVRYRPLASVLEEIEILRARGIREIHLADDNFTYDREYALAFCDAVTQRFPGLPWACPNGARLESLDDALLTTMRASGCHSIGLGIESGSQRMLDRIGKRLTLEQIRAAVQRVHAAGIAPVGFFILGLPGETPAEARQTIRLALELPLRRANFMLFQPLPGTRFWEELGAQRPERVQPSFAEVGYVPEGFTAASLDRLQQRAFLRFYGRPRTAWQLLSDIHSPRHAYWVFRRIWRWMKPRTGRLLHTSRGA